MCVCVCGGGGGGGYSGITLSACPICFVGTVSSESLYLLQPNLI